MRLSFASLAVTLLLAPRLATGLDVPILVQPVTPDGIPLRTWSAEPVSVGVPFAVEDGLDDIATLGMRGTSAAQFRVLQRDVHTGHITWVLATFIADGGPYAVTAGNGAFGGADLARLEGDRIVVENAQARFEIRRTGFDGLDRVVAAGAELVPSHSNGGIVLTAAAVRYESGLDTDSDVTIEENGPVMAVIRARGRLRAADGTKGLAYTARLHFYRGQSTCRQFVTLRNADLASLAAISFDAAWMEMPIALGSDRDVTFGFPGDGFSGRVPSQGTAHLFQGDNRYLRGPRTTDILANLTPAVGLEVEIDGQLHNALGGPTDVARGWMRCRDAQHAIFAGMRDFAVLFPSGLDLTANTMAVEMFSRRNPHPGLVFSWGAHETREMLFEFGDARLDSDRFHDQLQYPLVGRCAYERYRDTGAICGERRLVTVAEESQFFSDLGKRWQPARATEADLRFDRSYSFGTTGGSNQFDQDECHLIDYLRTGSGGRFQQGRFGALWKADQAVYHSDDFDYGTRQNGVSDVRVVQPSSFHGKGAGSNFDDEHPHWVCMALYYHLTGDEHVREAIEDYGEWRLYRAGNPTYGVIHGGGIHHMRLWSRCLRDVALLYELTGQARYLDATHEMARVLTTTLEAGTSMGRNLDRGYFFFGNPSDATRNIHLFFLIEMNAIGVQEAMRVLADDDPWKEELRDYLSGLAWFTLDEAQVVTTANGYPYEYASAVANPPPGVRGDQTGILLTHGYETSGDPSFVERSRQLAWRVPEYQHPLRASELSEQLRIWRWLHRDEMGVALVNPRAARNADGSWTLRWPVPAGVRRTIVKYGPRPLVETLGFDPVTHTFRIDPATAMNFWAAKNIEGEPVASPGPGFETWRTPVLPAGNWCFAVKLVADQPLAAVDPTWMRLGDVRLPAGPRSSASPVPTPIPAPGGSARLSLPGPDGTPVQARASSRAGVLQSHRVQVARRLDGARFVGLPPDAEVRMYDVAGHLLTTLHSDASGGIDWNGSDPRGRRVAPGVFLFRIDVDGLEVQRGRLVVVR